MDEIEEFLTDPHTPAKKFIKQFLNDNWIKLNAVSRDSIRGDSLKAKKPNALNPMLKVEALDHNIVAVHFHPEETGYYEKESERLDEILKSKKFQEIFPTSSPKLTRRQTRNTLQGSSKANSIIIEL